MSFTKNLHYLSDSGASLFKQALTFLPSSPLFQAPPPPSPLLGRALASVGAPSGSRSPPGLRAAAGEWYWDTIQICVIGLDQPQPPPIPPVSSVKSELKRFDNGSCAVQLPTGPELRLSL